MTRLLICGSRDYQDYDTMLDAVREVEDVEVVIHGFARGADTLADLVARDLSIPTERYPADWRRFGRSAGPIRNRQMLTEGKPDHVLAFKSKPKSAGTDNMIKQARAAGVGVTVVLGSTKEEQP